MAADPLMAIELPERKYRKTARGNIPTLAAEEARTFFLENRISVVEWLDYNEYKYGSKLEKWRTYPTALWLIQKDPEKFIGWLVLWRLTGGR